MAYIELPVKSNTTPLTPQEFNYLIDKLNARKLNNFIDVAQGDPKDKELLRHNGSGWVFWNIEDDYYDKQQINDILTGNGAIQFQVNWGDIVGSISNQSDLFSTFGALGAAQNIWSGDQYAKNVIITGSGETFDPEDVMTSIIISDGTLSTPLRDGETLTIQGSGVTFDADQKKYIITGGDGGSGGSGLWEDLTGNQSAVNISGFTNDTGFITGSDAKFNNYLLLSGGTLTGALLGTTANFSGVVKMATPIADNDGVNKLYLEGQGFITNENPKFDNYMLKSGGAFTGAITGTTANFTGAVGMAAPTGANSGVNVTYLDANHYNKGQIDAAITASHAGIKYVWADESGRLGQTGMEHFFQGLQQDTRQVWIFNDPDDDGTGTWIEYYMLDADHNHDERYYTQGQSDATFAQITSLANYLPLAGGVLTGEVTTKSNVAFKYGANSIQVYRGIDANMVFKAGHSSDNLKEFIFETGSVERFRIKTEGSYLLGIADSTSVRTGAINNNEAGITSDGDITLGVKTGATLAGSAFKTVAGADYTGVQTEASLSARGLYFNLINASGGWARGLGGAQLDGNDLMQFGIYGSGTNTNSAYMYFGRAYNNRGLTIGYDGKVNIGYTSGSMQGTAALSVNGNVSALAPTSDLHLATKKYVDDNVGSGGGGTITGITAGAGLEGGGTSGAVSLAIADNAVTVGMINSTNTATNGSVMKVNSSGTITWSTSINSASYATYMNQGTTTNYFDGTSTTMADRIFHVESNHGYLTTGTSDTDYVRVMRWGHGNLGAKITNFIGSSIENRGQFRIYSLGSTETRTQLQYHGDVAVMDNSSTYGQILSKGNWLRTPASGILPDANNGASLGTNSWRFANVYSNNVYVRDIWATNGTEIEVNDPVRMKNDIFFEAEGDALIFDYTAATDHGIIQSVEHGGGSNRNVLMIGANNHAMLGHRGANSVVQLRANNATAGVTGESTILQARRGTTTQEMVSIFSDKDVAGLRMIQPDATSYNVIRFGQNNTDNDKYIIAYNNSHASQPNEYAFKNGTGDVSFFAGSTASGDIRMRVAASYTDIYNYARVADRLYFSSNSGDIYGVSTIRRNTSTTMLTLSGSQVQIHGNLKPSSTSWDLGLVANPWDNVYANKYYGDGSNLTGVDGAPFSPKVSTPWLANFSTSDNYCSAGDFQVEHGDRIRVTYETEYNNKTDSQCIVEYEFFERVEDGLMLVRYHSGFAHNVTTYLMISAYLYRDTTVTNKFTIRNRWDGRAASYNTQHRVSVQIQAGSSDTLKNSLNMYSAWGDARTSSSAPTGTSAAATLSYPYDRMNFSGSYINGSVSGSAGTANRITGTTTLSYLVPNNQTYDNEVTWGRNQDELGLTGSGSSSNEVDILQMKTDVRASQPWVYALANYKNGDGLHIYKGNMSTDSKWTDFGAITTTKSGFFNDGGFVDSQVMQRTTIGDSSWFANQGDNVRLFRGSFGQLDLAGIPNTSDPFFDLAMARDSSMNGQDFVIPYLGLTLEGYRDVYLLAGQFADGTISQINSGLQVGFTQWVPDLTNTRCLAVNGTVGATGYYHDSLRIYKKNIKPFNKSGISIIEDIDIVTFDYKSEQSPDNVIGVIADDSPEEILSEEKDAVDLQKALAVAMKAIQELNDKVNQLEDDIRRTSK